MTGQRIGFVGLSHLGVVSGICAATKGCSVVIHDADAAAIARMDKGALPVSEPGLDRLFTEHRSRITLTATPAPLSDCEVVYIATDVPTDDTGTSDLSKIQDLIDRVLPHLGDTAVLTVLSQVPPGFTRSVPLPADRLCYQVETLVFGRAVERAMAPERYIVGLPDPAAGLPPALDHLLRADNCPILPMRLESAELAKISINMCLVASITVANMMGELCEAVGADWGEIAPSLKLDRRIGQHAYLTPGLGLSGGNLERDLATALKLSEEHDTNAEIVGTWISDSRYRKAWAARTLHRAGFPGATGARLAVLGLAYKENTASTKNAPALELIANLPETEIIAFDPIVDPMALGLTIKRAATAREAVKGADALALMTPWPEFRDIHATDLVRDMRGRIIVDPYGLLDSMETSRFGFQHSVIGRADLTPGHSA